jgi:hypothetical protein
MNLQFSATCFGFLGHLEAELRRVYIYCNVVKFYFQYNSPYVSSALDFLSLQISKNLNGFARSGGVFQAQTTLNITKPSGNHVCLCCNVRTLCILRTYCACVPVLILRNSDCYRKEHESGGICN